MSKKNQDEFHFSGGDAMVVLGTLFAGMLAAAVVGWAESKKEKEKTEQPEPPK